MVFKKKGKPAVKSYVSNPCLITIKQDWPGTPLDQNELFIYPENPTILSFSEVLKYMHQKNPQRHQKKTDTWRISVRTNEDWLADPDDKIVWLGHASFFIQLSGMRILIDPMFGKLTIVKRYSAFPIPP